MHLPASALQWVFVCSEQSPLKWWCCEKCSRREALERIWLDAVAVAVLLLWERGSGESGNDGKGRSDEVLGGERKATKECERKEKRTESWDVCSKKRGKGVVAL